MAPIISIGSSEHPVVVTDERTCALFTISRTAAGRLHADERARLANAHESEHQHGRPTLLGRGAPTGPQHTAAPTHADEEEHRRFAREVAQWIADTLPPDQRQRVSLFAAPRFLGLLRPELERRNLGIRAGQGELTRLTAPELAQHPAIRAIADHLPVSTS